MTIWQYEPTQIVKRTEFLCGCEGWPENQDRNYGGQCLPNFVVPRKMCFKHIIKIMKIKNLVPWATKMYFTPQTLNLATQLCFFVVLNIMSVRINFFREGNLDILLISFRLLTSKQTFTKSRSTPKRKSQFYGNSHKSAFRWQQ